MAKSKKAKKSKKPAAAKKNVTLEKDEEAEKSAESVKENEKKSEKKDSKKEDSKKDDKKGDKKDEKKPSAFAQISKYFRECRSEVKKIVWPTPQATFKNVGIVLSVLLVVGLFVYALDTGFIALLKLVMDI